MHQASILFTFMVMAMAGAWYVMQDNARRETESPAVQEQVVAHNVAMAAPAGVRVE